MTGGMIEGMISEDEVIEETEVEREDIGRGVVTIWMTMMSIIPRRRR
jgi:hypothetical protein